MATLEELIREAVELRDAAPTAQGEMFAKLADLVERLAVLTPTPPCSCSKRAAEALELEMTDAGIQAAIVAYRETCMDIRDNPCSPALTVEVVEAWLRHEGGEGEWIDCDVQLLINAIRARFAKEAQ